MSSYSQEGRVKLHVGEHTEFLNRISRQGTKEIEDIVSYCVVLPLHYPDNSVSRLALPDDSLLVCLPSSDDAASKVSTKPFSLINISHVHVLFYFATCHPLCARACSCVTMHTYIPVWWYMYCNTGCMVVYVL